MDLALLIKSEAFIVCPLISARNFQDYCEARGIDLDQDRLERFERLGLLAAILRMNITEGSWPSFWDANTLGDLVANGKVWDPKTRAFAPWSTFRDERGMQRTESYYSIFQCYSAYELVKGLTMKVNAEEFEGISESDFHGLGKNIAENSKLAQSIVTRTRTATLPLLCQLLSNRYFPQTQSDRRTIRLTSRFHPQEWLWEDYVKSWDAGYQLRLFGIDIDAVKKFHDSLKVSARSIDPIEAWYSLVSFVNLDKRARLKTSALYAQTLYSMEGMLRRFIKDVTGSPVAAPDELTPGSNDSFYGQGVTGNVLEYLEFLTNQFHLNPRPRALLIVEGNGEAEVFPKLFVHYFGLPLDTLQIELMNLNGVGNFTGDRRQDKFGALEKLIDVYHHNQTVVFLVLDKEGRVEAVKEKLIQAQSKLFPARTVTKNELIHLWDKSIEFDNFSNDEIASAMTATVNGQATFAPAEIEVCRTSEKTLNQLCKEKAGFELPKVKNLVQLFESFVFITNPKPRPIVDLIRRIADFVTLNHPPVNSKIKAANQASGYFAGRP